MNKEALKDICRSMITASHYNNLDDAEFDNYIEGILALNKPISSMGLSNTMRDYEANRITENFI